MATGVSDGSQEVVLVVWSSNMLQGPAAESPPVMSAAIKTWHSAQREGNVLRA